VNVDSGNLNEAVTKIKVVTSAGSSFTVYGYNAAGTQIFTTTPSPTSPAKTGNYGIVRGASVNYTSVDNFSVT
jgi:hypothetical protein